MQFSWAQSAAFPRFRRVAQWGGKFKNSIWSNVRIRHNISSDELYSVGYGSLLLTPLVIEMMPKNESGLMLWRSCIETIRPL